MRAEDRVLALGAVASLGAHLAAVALLPVSHARAGAGLDPREVEFTVSLPEPPAAPPTPSPPPTPLPAPPPTTSPPDRPTPAPSAAIVGLPPPGATDAAPLDGRSPEPEPDPPDEDEARRRRAALLDLSPSAVARAGMRLELPSGPVDPDTGRRTTEARDGAFYGERGASLASGIARDVNRRPTGPRPPPDLRRSTDGGYRWSGPLVSARIAPDGTVTFDDGPGVSVGLGEGGGSGLGGRFDLNDAIERGRGNDPRAAEKHWFLRETEALRDRLARGSLDERLSLAERRLLGQLRQIWGDLETSAGERRARIFRLWDGLAEDEVGDRARAVVERFVRNELPAGSDDAFPPAQLAALNGRRASARPFAPYP